MVELSMVLDVGYTSCQIKNNPLHYLSYCSKLIIFEILSPPQIWETICQKTIIKLPTTPKKCCYTI